MTSYTGNGAYCYANSLYMALREAGAAADELPEPGFIECLTTMPFGTLYLRVGRELLEEALIHTLAPTEAGR
jgi:hypothetical protein